MLFILLLALVSGQEPPLDTLTLPPGFNIEVFANRSWNVRGPRQMNVQFYQGATIIFVGTLNTNFKNPIALIDRNSDNVIDESYILWDAPRSSNHIDSLSIHPKTGQLFLSDMNQTYKCSGNAVDLVLNHFTANSRFSCEKWFFAPYTDPGEHCMHYQNFNPANDELCIAYGQPCNECLDRDNTPPKSTIICYNTDTATSILEGTIYAAGVRNSYGHAFHPTTGKLWFSDNGRDNLLTTTNMPDDELNVVNEIGEFFGHPWCHSLGCGDPYKRDINCVTAITDPLLGDGGVTNNCTVNFTLSIQPMSPHTAVLGIGFYTGSMFPAKYKNAIFIAEHGSWDRTPMIGYRMSVVFLDDSGNKVIENDNFIQGWLNDTTQSVWGRVNDLDFLADGSMIINDDQQSVLYRVWYDASYDTPGAQQKYKIEKERLRQAYHDAYDRFN